MSTLTSPMAFETLSLYENMTNVKCIHIFAGSSKLFFMLQFVDCHSRNCSNVNSRTMRLFLLSHCISASYSITDKNVWVFLVSDPYRHGNVWENVASIFRPYCTYLPIEENDGTHELRASCLSYSFARMEASCLQKEKYLYVY